MSVQMPMHFSTEKTPLIIGYTPDSKIGFMKLQTVENYKIKQLGLYFPTVADHKKGSIQGHIQNQITEYIATPNMHMRFRYLPNNVIRNIDKRIIKIKKLKLRHPTATCHWDDNTIHHCDIIYENLQKIKANILRLKILEPVKISSWDIDLTPFPDDILSYQNAHELELKNTITPVKKTFFHRRMVFITR